MKVLRILRNIGLIVLALLLIGIGIIYWKKDSLIRSAVDTTAESIGVDIQYKTASLSLFSAFPDVGISLDSLVIASPDNKSQPISSIDQLTLGINFWSLFSEQGYELKQIILERPRVDLNCNSKGKCNYDILLEEDEESVPEDQSSGMELSIENFEIIDGIVSYTDSMQVMQVNIDQWNFQLQGNYADNIFNADLDQEDMVLNLMSGGIQYADSLHIRGNGQIQYDLAESRIEIEENSWSLNELEILLNGMFVMQEGPYEMDISFDLPNNELKPLLSLIPAFYDDNYTDLITEGSFTLDGNLKGQLDTENEIYPAFLINTSIQQGRIRYPDLPDDIHDIALNAKIEKEEGDLDKTIIDVPGIQMKMGADSELNGSFNMSNPISNPIVNGSLLLNADMNNVQQVYPVESIEEIAGLLNMDADFNFSWDQLQNEQYDQVEISGNASLNNFNLKISNQPLITLGAFKASMGVNGIEADINNLKAGASDISTATVSTGPLGIYFQENKNFPMDISFTAESIFVDEWLTEETPDDAQETLSTPYDLSGYRIAFDGQIAELVYTTYQIKGIDVSGVFENGQIQIDRSQFTYEGSDFTVEGRVTQLEEYLNEKGPYKAVLKLDGDRFDLYEYMYGVEDASVAQETNGSEEYFYVSPDMTLDIEYNMAGIDYGKIAFSNVRGSMNLVDGNITINSTEMNGMGGQLNLEGKLRTSEGEAPIFDFNTAVQSLQFSKAFSSIVSLEKIAPLLGRLQGIFDARLSTTGTLDKELFPQYSDLDAQGFLATKNVTLQSYEPISRLDNVIGTNLSNNFPLDNTQNWFAIEDGAVIIEPFTIPVLEDIWQVQGRHQIDGEMNYQFSGPIPMEVIKRSEEGRQLVEEAERIFNQIPLTSDISLEKVDIQLLLTGTRSNPRVKLNLANNFRDLITQRVQEEIKSQKEEIKKEAKETLDEAGQTVKDAAKQKAREVLTGKKDSTNQGATVDSLKQQAEDKLKKAKEKLKKWDPFKN